MRLQNLNPFTVECTIKSNKSNKIVNDFARLNLSLWNPLSFLSLDKLGSQCKLLVESWYLYGAFLNCYSFEVATEVSCFLMPDVFTDQYGEFLNLHWLQCRAIEPGTLQSTVTRSSIWATVPPFCYPIFVNVKVFSSKSFSSL